ncbi:hypothetical protein P4S68_11255, partial [Pseudoalteromonas sp. Hal099]
CTSFVFSLNCLTVFAFIVKRFSRFSCTSNVNNALNFDAPALVPRENHKKRCDFAAENIPERYIFIAFSSASRYAISELFAMD